MDSGYESEQVEAFLRRVAIERPSTASEVATIWWSIIPLPPGYFAGGEFAADSIDLRETMMAIATAVGGPKNLPAPLDELWEPLGVEQWELRRLGQLRSWHAAARMTDSMSGGEVPNVWPHPTGPRRVATTHDLDLDSADPVFPGAGATDDNQDRPK